MNQPKFFVTPGYGEHMLNKLHYSQAVKIGDRVETSGQGGWNDKKPPEGSSVISSVRQTISKCTIAPIISG